MKQDHPAVHAALEALAKQPTCPHVVMVTIAQSARCDECTASAATTAVLRWAAEYIVRHHINLTGYAISEHIDAWADEIVQRAAL